MAYPAPKTAGDAILREIALRAFLDHWPGSPYEAVENNILHKKLREVFESQPFTDALTEAALNDTTREIPDGNK